MTPHPGDDPVDAIYATRFPENDLGHARWRRELWQVLVDDWFSRWIPDDATLIDFGCGSGGFINAARCRRRHRPSGRRELMRRATRSSPACLPESICDAVMWLTSSPRSMKRPH